MAKYPWMKLFPSDLDRDCRCLTLSSFGAWVRIFMDLHFYKGERSLSLDSWSRVISATIPQTALALQEIIRAGVCDSNVSADVLPTKTDAFIMIRCRRIAREFKLRQTHNLRQQKYSNKRSNDAQNDASMTVQMSEAKKTDAINMLDMKNKSLLATKQKIVDLFLSKGKGDRERAIKMAQKLINSGDMAPDELGRLLEGQAIRMNKEMLLSKFTSKGGTMSTPSQYRNLREIKNMIFNKE